MTQAAKALVLGATGGIGSEVARALRARGWEVTALHLDPSRAAASNPHLTWVQGDAMDRAAVVSAAAGASVIVHGVNPPGYRNWAGLVLPMIDNTISAASATGARILLPGTVYNYGPDAGTLVDEQAPQNPETRKGRIRVELERRLHSRGQDSAEVIADRMQKSRGEISHWAEYDYVIVNHDIDDSTRALQTILMAERMRRARQVGLGPFVRALMEEERHDLGT